MLKSDPSTSAIRTLLLLRRRSHSHSHSQSHSLAVAPSLHHAMNPSSPPPPPPPSNDAEGRYAFNPTLNWNPDVQAYFSAAYGSHHFARISAALARPSCYSCIRVNTLTTSTPQVRHNLLQYLQRSGFADDDDDSCISQIPGLENVLCVRGTGPHQVCYECRPDNDDDEQLPLKEVVVSRKCAEAVLRGAQIYVPGVMACSVHVEKGDKVAVSVATEKMTDTGAWVLGITRGTVLHGNPSDVRYKERHGLYIGEGVALMSRAGIFRAKEGVAIDMTNRVYRLPSFNDVLEGEIFLQNLPSIITARVLGKYGSGNII